MSDTELNFYKKAAKYWSEVPATINGVLGGYEHISGIDISGSQAFLQYIFTLGKVTSRKRALDVGSGIGRICKNLLMPHFDKVDLLEQDSKFIEASKDYINDLEHVGTLYNIPIQDFVPSKKYDLIWCQWSLGNLKDVDMILFLQRCSKALSDNGVIVVKDNVTSGETIEYDEVDSSVTRPYKLMQVIFKEAQLKVLKERIQTNFPQDIYTVISFSLTPMTSDDCQ